MASIIELVAKATENLHEQKFSDDFIRKYVAIWRKLQVYAQKYRIDEFSWDLACSFLREEFDIDIDGDDIYSADCKKKHYTTVRPLLYLLLLQNDIGLIRSTKIGLISLEAFSDVLDRFTSNCMQRHLRQSTIDGKMWTVRPFLMYLRQNGIDSTESLKTLNKEKVTGFIQFLTARALNTIADKVNVLREFLSFLCKEQFTEQDLSLYVPKVARRRQRLAHTWTPDETERLLNAIERGTSVGKRDYAIFMIAIHLGMRSGDILSLKFEDINWAKCTIHFTQEKTGVPQELPLSAEIGSAIIDYLKHGRPDDPSPYVFIKHIVPYGKMKNFWYPNMLKQDGSMNNNPLFFNHRHEPLSRSGIGYILQKYVNSARKERPAIPEKVTPHILRHSKAMHLLEAGVNIVYIRDILGHVNIATTGIYARSNLEMKRKALEKVAIIPDATDVPFWTEDKDLLSWLEGFGKSL